MTRMSLVSGKSAQGSLADEAGDSEEEPLLEAVSDGDCEGVLVPDLADPEPGQAGVSMTLDRRTAHNVIAQRTAARRVYRPRDPDVRSMLFPGSWRDMECSSCGKECQSTR